MLAVEIKVSAYSGYRGDEVPRKLYRQGMWYDISEIRQSWLEPGKRFFDVHLHGISQMMRIYYDEKAEEWFLCKNK